jgi:6-phosphogluconolactonase
MTHEPIIDIAADAEDMAMRAALWLATRIVVASEPFALNLAGGSTPKRVYELLASAAFKPYIDWNKVHLFWGDERFVPIDHKDSNYRMVHEAMIAHVPIPPDHIHRVPVEAGTPEKAAALYEEDLQRFYGARYGGAKSLDPARPLFDVTLLGLGTDGHTASLFPGTKALDERESWTIAVIGVKAEARVSLTYPAIEASAAVLFLVAGEEKRAALAGVLAKDLALPAARLETDAPVLWFVDRAAVTETGATPQADASEASAPSEI